MSISASGSPITKGHSSALIPESWGASEYGSKGVTIIREPESTESVDKIDLGLERLHLRRRRTKATIPITAKTTPLMIPPTIAPVFLLCFLEDGKIRRRAGIYCPHRNSTGGFSQE